MEKKTKSTLQELGNFLAKIAEKSDDVYWLSSPDFKNIIYISPAFEKVWGRPREPLYKNPKLWDNYLFFEDMQKHHPIQAMAQRIAELGATARYDESYRIVRPNGEIRWIIDRGFPIYDENNKCCGVTGIAIDITEDKIAEVQLREAKERAEQANRCKSEFLASMSHDLRTPLNGILGMAQILQAKLEDPELLKFVNAICEAGYQQLRLIEDILNFSKLEAGKLSLRSEPFNLQQLVEELVGFFAYQAHQKNIRLIIDYNETVPKYIINDPHCLRRILINLIENALKFTDSGHILIQIEAIKINKHTATIQFCIEDTGIGISADKLDFIFERFNRIEPSYKSKYKGTGLGLTTVKQLTEMLGGKITVSSKPGKGSTFCCILPFKLQKITRRESIWQRHYSDIRILLVDDHDIRGKTIIKQLNSTNNQLVSGQKALATLLKAYKNRQPYHIIIIDDEIKGITSNALAQAISEHDGLNNIMLILFSKPASLAEIEQAKEAGFFLHLIKPVPPSELIKCLTCAWESWLNLRLNNIEQLKQYSPSVLLIETDQVIQQAIVSMLNDLGCQVMIAENEKQAITYNKSFDLILLDIESSAINSFALIKSIKQQDDPDNPSRIIAIATCLSDKERGKYLAAGVDDFLAKPLTKENLLQMLSQLFDINISALQENNKLAAI